MPMAAPAAVPACPTNGFPDLNLCYRIYCDLCGRTAAAEPGLQDREASAAFAGKGWRLYRDGGSSRRSRLTVCRSCARHLGPRWLPISASVPADGSVPAAPRAAGLAEE
jgi:hypothetical protein